MSTTTHREQQISSRQQQFRPGTTADEIEPLRDAAAYLKAYAKERPDVAALWCFGIGFILGWKLKLW